MAPGISLDDRGAWDDSALISSWDDAVAEYQKYHSIQQSGKRLEDVLTAEELRELREEHGDLMEEVETRSSAANPNANADHEDTGLPQEQANGVWGNNQSGAHAEEQAASGHQENTRITETCLPHDGVPASLPQAMLGTVQDENVKNLMMSWYYAGYYTGLYAGQQEDKPDKATAKK